MYHLIIKIKRAGGVSWLNEYAINIITRAPFIMMFAILIIINIYFRSINYIIILHHCILHVLIYY